MPSSLVRRSASGGDPAFLCRRLNPRGSSTFLKPQTPKSKPVSASRAAAYDILMRVERESSFASELLHSAAYDSLSAADHALATELVMGVLRWRSSLDDEIAQASTQALPKLDLEILTALRVALYQLRWLDRVPARAAINESVELVKRARKRSAAPFVNAVLRKLEKPERMRTPEPQETAEDLARVTAHPFWLVERWIREFGFAGAQCICRSNQSVPVTAIRVRGIFAEEENKSTSAQIVFDPGALLTSARRIRSGDTIRLAELFRNQFVIQDEASQLLAALAGRGSLILDCCAAPGGKARAMADGNPGATVLAVDLHPHRARLLQRLMSTGNQNIRIVAADARHLPFAAMFDRVLADVPCSGTGTLARNPEIKWRLQPEDLADLQTRQLAILRAAMKHTAVGGKVIYSTCSLEKEENEDVIEKALAEEKSFRLLDCRAELDRLTAEGELIWSGPASLTRGLYLRTIPEIHPCDGFFAAILERT
jgi:16S rRNA (cytosine967-C5)-methyltransferase